MWGKKPSLLEEGDKYNALIFPEERKKLWRKHRKKNCPREQDPSKKKRLHGRNRVGGGKRKDLAPFTPATKNTFGYAQKRVAYVNLQEFATELINKQREKKEGRSPGQVHVRANRAQIVQEET